MKNYVFNSLFLFQFRIETNLLNKKLEKEGIIRVERDLLNGKNSEIFTFFQ